MYVYLITNKVNGKHYVGKSINPDDRWAQHRANAVMGFQDPVYRAIRKYGIDNFSFEVIDTCCSEQASLDREVERIAEYESYGPKGYNQTPGGEGIIITPELLQKWSEMRKGKPMPPNAKPARDAVLAKKTQETDRLVREAHAIGLNLREIAKAIDRSPGLVSTSCKKQGLKLPGLTPERIKAREEKRQQAIRSR